MDLAFSTKPHQSLLLSSSSAVSQFLSPHRSEFLGCAHSLRPPGVIRSRTRCKRKKKTDQKFGFQFHTTNSPNFIVRAIDSQSVIVIVSFIAVSAATAIYFNSKRNGSRTGIRQATNSKVMQEKMSVNIVTPVDVQREAPSDEQGVAETKMGTIGLNYDDKATEVGFSETGLIHEAALSSNTVASSISGSSSTEYSAPYQLPKSDALLSNSVIDNILVEGGGVNTEVGVELPTLVSPAKLNATSIPVGMQAAVIELEKPTQKLCEGDAISSLTSLFTDSERRGLYTFYDASTVDLNGVETVASHTFHLENSGFSSLIKSSMAERPKDLKSDFLPRTDYSGGRTSVGSNRLRSSHRRRASVTSKDFSTANEVTDLPQNGHYCVNPSFDQEQKYMTSKGHHSRQSDAYRKFLKDERLTECIEILEDMEKKGLLDMDKVYHAGFYQVCRTKKAVNEAFRFTKLIPNPTMSTFNMVMSVCASSQDSEGAFQVLQLVQDAGFKADCKLYTTLISTCAKSGKVDAMFKVFHEMVNAGVEPNVHTYGALIDGCAKAGQVAKAFGAYGIMRSKNVKPDRVVFNALITACGQAGAVDRAFDVLAEMGAEIHPIEPDHITIGALMKACANAGQVDRAREVYHMIDKYKIKGTPEVYTIAVNSSSQSGDWDFACSVFNDMTRKDVAPDETFISAMIDVAGHAGKLDSAFGFLEEARNRGITVGIISYSSLMGACCNARNWQKALELYEDIKSLKLKRTVPMMNALMTVLCDADKLQRALEVLFEMKREGLCPNTVTYSVLLVASEKKDDIEVGLKLFAQAKEDGVAPNLVMCRCMLAMCLRRYQKACALGEPVLSFNSTCLQVNSKWTSLALTVYRETIMAGVAPTMEELSQILGCLQLPHDASLRNRLIDNLRFSSDMSKSSKLCSLVDGFGEYDPRAFSLLEEAASLGIIPLVSFKESPIVVDVRNLGIYAAEVYLLTVLKGLKHRLAAGARLPNISILLPVEKIEVQTATKEKIINVSGRISQAVTAMLRRLGLPYLGNESYGKVRINGISVKKWFKPKVNSPFNGKQTDFSLSGARLGKGITQQQRNIRTGNLSLQ